MRARSASANWSWRKYLAASGGRSACAGLMVRSHTSAKPSSTMLLMKKIYAPSQVAATSFRFQHGVGNKNRASTVWRDEGTAARVFGVARNADQQTYSISSMSDII